MIITRNIKMIQVCRGMINSKLIWDLNYILIEFRQKMEGKSNIREELADISGNPEMLFADGYDDALIGYTDSGVAVYCIEDIIMIMVNEEEMTEEDALEHFYYNVAGSYVGEYTPIYIHELRLGNAK